MPDLYFTAEFPAAPAGRLIAQMRSGDYLATETVDAALQCAGQLNALRGTDSPTPFGAAVDGDLADLTPCELCDRLEAAIAGEGFGTSPIVIAILTRLVELVLRLTLPVPAQCR